MSRSAEPLPTGRAAGSIKRCVALLAESPDAGRFHHRFLASSDSGIDAATATEWFAQYRAVASGTGPDFLGVERAAVHRSRTCRFFHCEISTAMSM